MALTTTMSARNRVAGGDDRRIGAQAAVSGRSCTGPMIIDLFRHADVL
jgi:hypothetical protein